MLPGKRTAKRLFGDGVHDFGCLDTLGWMVRVERT